MFFAFFLVNCLKIFVVCENSKKVIINAKMHKWQPMRMQLYMDDIVWV